VSFRIPVRARALLDGMPALAFLPTRDMTSAEMDRCRKMVGDYHIGPEHLRKALTPKVKPIRTNAQ
jgi:hypothetical protein